MPSVIRLPVSRCPSVAEKSRRLGVSAQTEILELTNARTPNAFSDIAGEIEHGVPVALRWRKEPRIGGIRRKETFDKFRAHFVIWLSNGWAERGGDARAVGTKPFHRRHSRLDHAAKRAAPAGMRCAHDAGLAVGEQQWSAIGSGHTDRQARHARHNGVGTWAILARP